MDMGMDMDMDRRSMVIRLHRRRPTTGRILLLMIPAIPDLTDPTRGNRRQRTKVNTRVLHRRLHKISSIRSRARTDMIKATDPLNFATKVVRRERLLK